MFVEEHALEAPRSNISPPVRSGKQPIQPAKRVAAVACMDARLDVEDLLGLQTGDAARAVRA